MLWLPPQAGQQPSAPRPTLQRTTGQKNLVTNEIVVHTNIRAEVGNVSPRRRQLSDLRSSARGRLGSADDDCLHALRHLAGSGRGQFRSQRRLATAGGGGLRTPPRSLRFTPRIGEPDDRPTLLRSILAVLVHHCRHNNSNVSSVRENPQATSYTRRRHVFALCPGDNNRTINGSIQRPDSACHWTHGYPISANPLSSARSDPRSSPHRLPPRARMQQDLGHANPA
jgi:hypothetical protein